MKPFINNTIIASTLMVGALLFSSCDGEEREQLRAQAEQLEQQLHERDSAFNSIMNIMADVETQIEEIKAQEKLISTQHSSDFVSNDGEQMVSDLKKISDLINDTNAKVAGLNTQLENSNLELKAFRRKVNKMTADLKERETVIVQLRDELESKNLHIAELDSEVNTLVTRVQLQTETIDMQAQEIESKIGDLNTAFFAVDTEKKLKDEGLVTKEGGFLWIGRSTELQADAAQGKFTEVDILNTRRFYIDSDKMEIVTEHPSESYKLVNENNKVKYLEVTDPNKFWQISKYLVISIKS